MLHLSISLANANPLRLYLIIVIGKLIASRKRKTQIPCPDACPNEHITVEVTQSRPTAPMLTKKVIGRIAVEKEVYCLMIGFAKSYLSWSRSAAELHLLQPTNGLALVGNNLSLPDERN